MAKTSACTLALSALLALLDDAVAILAPPNQAHRLERRDAVLGVHGRGRDGSDHAKLRVRAHEALHEHARQVAAAVGHGHVPAALRPLDASERLCSRAASHLSLRARPGQRGG